MEFSEELVKQVRLLVALGKLSNRQVLERLRKDIESDPVSAKIFDLCEKETSISNLAKELVESNITSERTLARRISELTDLGILAQTKRGIYSRSGILD